jgi:hypothetical protein
VLRRPTEHGNRVKSLAEASVSVDLPAIKPKYIAVSGSIETHRHTSLAWYIEGCQAAADFISVSHVEPPLLFAFLVLM